MWVSIKKLAVLTIAAGMAFPVIAGDYTSINSDVRVGAGSSADNVQSVNGSIRIGDEAVVRSVNSVNGSIKIGRGVTVERRIEAVNGAISLDSGSQVGEGVESVNGTIELQGTHVAGDIDTINGGIRLLDGTVIAGNVKVRKPNNWGWNNKRSKPVKVEIGQDVQVHGNLVFEHAVELRVHESATYGDIVGDEVTLIDIE
ncbi:MAG TPA: hypothetical protein VJ984_04325 [Xanthomonadales bacterium]|nr:hypothetical protein [Xanthomonadales bacterium]